MFLFEVEIHFEALLFFSIDFSKCLNLQLNYHILLKSINVSLLYELNCDNPLNLLSTISLILLLLHSLNVVLYYNQTMEQNNEVLHHISLIPNLLEHMHNTELLCKVKLQILIL